MHDWNHHNNNFRAETTDYFVHVYLTELELYTTLKDQWHNRRIVCAMSLYYIYFFLFFCNLPVCINMSAQHWASAPLLCAEWNHRNDATMLGNLDIPWTSTRWIVVTNPPCPGLFWQQLQCRPVAPRWSAAGSLAGGSCTPEVWFSLSERTSWPAVQPAVLETSST